MIYVIILFCCQILTVQTAVCATLVAGSDEPGSAPSNDPHHYLLVSRVCMSLDPHQTIIPSPPAGISGMYEPGPTLSNDPDHHLLLSLVCINLQPIPSNDSSHHLLVSWVCMNLHPHQAMTPITICWYLWHI